MSFFTKELSYYQERYIKNRDHWKCQKCGFNGLNLEVCYIIPFEKCQELHWPTPHIKHPHNLILLCPHCKDRIYRNNLPMMIFNNPSFKDELQRKAKENTENINQGFPRC
jgi:hypothetical protein